MLWLLASVPQEPGGPWTCQSKVPHAILHEVGPGTMSNQANIKALHCLEIRGLVHYVRQVAEILVVPGMLKHTIQGPCSRGLSVAHRA